MTKSIVESELTAAADDLYARLDAAPPPFKPTRRKAPAIAAAALLLIGGGSYLGLRDDVQTVRTPVVDSGESEAGDEEQSSDLSNPDDEDNVVDSEDAVAPVFGPDATPPAESGAPDVGRGEEYIDPVYGTPVRKLTSADGTRFDVVVGPNRSVESADGQLILSYHGTDGYRVTDRLTGDVIGEVRLPLVAEPQWHPTNGALVRHLGEAADNNGLRLLETNVLTGNTEIVADVGGRLQNTADNGVQWPDATRMHTNEQGASSGDGSLWALIAEDSNGQSLGVFSYDLADQQLISRVAVRTDVGAINSVTASVEGGYVVVGYDDATFVYDRNLENERQLHEGNDPGDVALAADGSETYVVANFSADEEGGWLLAIDLETLERTRVLDIYEGGNTSINVSGRAFDKPGWAVVSTFDCKVNGAWTCDKVMAVELVANGRIVNLAHTYNCGESFWTEPSAVPSVDLSRVYFNSDTGSCGEDGELFELTAPSFD